MRTARDSARFKIKSRAKESAKRRRPSLRGAAKRPHSERSERFKIKVCCIEIKLLSDCWRNSQEEFVWSEG